MLPSRFVIAIPHYFGPPAIESARHGSSLATRQVRAAALRRTVMSLHQTFGNAQCMMQLARRSTDSANTLMRMTVQVIICTTPDRHLLNDCGLPAGSFEHVACDVPPLELGFACHRELAKRVDAGLWFAYLEDDILVNDPLLLTKLNWFTESSSFKCVLQPNRFERDERLLATKAYVDGDLPARCVESWCDLQEAPELQFEVLNSPLRFVRPSNPHSGCFFLRQDQMLHWTKQSGFGEPSSAFVGPLESAATLGICSTSISTSLRSRTLASWKSNINRISSSANYALAIHDPCKRAVGSEGTSFRK